MDTAEKKLHYFADQINKNAEAILSLVKLSTKAGIKPPFPIGNVSFAVFFPKRVYFCNGQIQLDVVLSSYPKFHVVLDILFQSSLNFTELQLYLIC